MLPRARRPRGFTLVELMLVVALVALLLALAAPSMREMIEMRRLRGVAAQVVTDLQFARSEAVARRTLVRVWLQEDATHTCYTLFTAPTPLMAQRCSCLLGEGNACPAGSTEIKTVRLARAQKVLVGAPSARKAFAYEPSLGSLVSIPTDIDPIPLPSYAVDVRIDDRLQLRVALTQNGRPSLCKPAGSVIEEPAC